MASPSAWTAKAHGVTMSLSSGFGGRSNTRRYISGPTTRCPRPGLPSADTSASTIAKDHIRALTGRRPIRPTSPRCRMSRRLNPGRRSTYQTEEAVQTRGASSATKYLIRDNDRAFGGAFKARVRAMGIRDRPTSFRSPWQNGYAERLIGSLRRECTDHLIAFNADHLRRILAKYAIYYNEVRTHVSLGKDAPCTRPIERFGEVVAHPILGGLHHRYARI